MTKLSTRLARLKRKWTYRTSVRRAASGPVEPIVVFSMAKSASTTIEYGLMSVDGLPVFKVHRIHPTSIRNYRLVQQQSGWSGPHTYLDDLGVALYRELITRGRSAKIITTFRDPIGRNISAYFQMLDQLWRVSNAHEAVPLHRLMDEFPNKGHHEVPLTWFDEEFKSVLGIDVFNHAFPREKGYLRIRDGQFDVLLMRHDLDDESKERSIRELLGLDDFSLVGKNVAEEKPYAETYRRFVGEIRLPEEYVARMLDSRYTRHFFTASEIEQMRSKWLRTARSHSGP